MDLEQRDKAFLSLGPYKTITQFRVACVLTHLPQHDQP